MAVNIASFIASEPVNLDKQQEIRVEQTKAGMEENPNVATATGVLRVDRKTAETGLAETCNAKRVEHWSRIVLSMVRNVFVWICYLYVLWVLASVVAWVSHLGKRVPMLQRVLAAKGFPSNPPVSTVLELSKVNLANALLFVLPHSLLNPRVLQRIPFFGRRHSKLAYNLIAAVSLHWFIFHFRPLKAKVLFIVPLGEIPHAILSFGCLVFAMVCFVRDRRTEYLVGVTQSLHEGERPPKNPGLPAKMDAITWMGITVWKAAGAWGFILFSGISILPREVTINDIAPRVVAAMYLRLRSIGFNRWVNGIESVHHATWIIRGCLLLTGLYYSGNSASKFTIPGLLVIAFVIATVLHRIERRPSSV